ncbi:MAG: GNAT family N-acetyltransferase [Rhodospirillaceae bacterium]|jgi:[ribosomal protein S5]-alanine N-acetyltransferase|nr:GNAT family N-acetyltransferase [Rhodospirillaceae bacterium]MBT6117628.1 GNAT family N-acetyltransferase [Rhodospirillaceae bacterium]
MTDSEPNISGGSELPPGLAAIEAIQRFDFAGWKRRTLRARDIDLRPFRVEEVGEDYHRWLHDPAIIQNIEAALADRSMEGLRAHVQRVWEHPTGCFYRVVHRETETAIGTASLRVDTKHGTATWGYLIGEVAYRSDGMSLQAQVPLFDIAFDEIGLRRFWGFPFREHIASQFNLRRMGFKQEGVLRQHMRSGAQGERISDCIAYGLLREDWDEARGKFDHLRYPGHERA